MTGKGNEVRVLLQKHQLTNVWLINRLEEQGVITDKTELSSSLSGTRRGNKVDRILNTSIEILDRYEKCFVGATDDSM